MFVVRAVAPGPDGKRDFRWLTERTEACLTGKARGIECVDERDGRVVAMMVYDQLTHNSCFGHLAIDVPAAWRRLARPTFEYPFRQLGKGVMFCGISHLNDRSLALVRHLGFREIARFRDFVNVGVDMLFFEMRRETCRWLEG